MDLIAAVTEDWGLGYRNQLLVHISADLRRFKKLTMGHAVLMGRKTLVSLPGGRPLPGRRNLVLTGRKDWAPDGVEVFGSIPELLKAAPEDAFVIGGASVYRALLPYCSTAYLTKVRTVRPADCYFPDLDRAPDWHLAEESDEQEEGGLRFTFATYRKTGEN